MGEPFKRCPTCGTPRVHDTCALVLYFDTDEDRASFVEVFKEVHPNASSYPVDTPPKSSEPEDKK